eukprot:scaffold107132_cov36-Phaeocystis_antarctica.AAC.1
MQVDAALGRQARGSSDFCAVLLKNNTAGLATAMRLHSESTVDRARKRQQPQLDVSRRSRTWSVKGGTRWRGRAVAVLGELAQPQGHCHAPQRATDLPGGSIPGRWVR